MKCLKWGGVRGIMFVDLESFHVTPETAGWMDNGMDRWISVRMDGWMDGWMGLWMDGWLYILVRMGGCMDGWTEDGRNKVDKWTEIWRAENEWQKNDWTTSATRATVQFLKVKNRKSTIAFKTYFIPYIKKLDGRIYGRMSGWMDGRMEG